MMSFNLTKFAMCAMLISGLDIPVRWRRTEKGYVGSRQGKHKEQNRGAQRLHEKGCPD